MWNKNKENNKIQIQDFWCFKEFHKQVCCLQFSSGYLRRLRIFHAQHFSTCLCREEQIIKHLFWFNITFRYPTWNLGIANGSWMSVYKYLKNGSVCKRSISQSDLKSQQSLDMHLTSLNLYCIESKIQVNSLYRIVEGFSLLEILDFLGL